ncbi:MAG: NAD(P)-binding domain-containing protein, partial [Campylobacterales bacterium]|nr:NAD(P)-binding domain-containing protein [Campylobacterales bacterium]
MKLAIIGAGKWGQALYHAYASNKDNDVVITSRTPKDIENYVSLDEALEREYLIIALPAQIVRGW